jgi:hypothetical protein
MKSTVIHLLYVQPIPDPARHPDRNEPDSHLMHFCFVVVSCKIRRKQSIVHFAAVHIQLTNKSEFATMEMNRIALDFAVRKTLAKL